LPEELHRKRVLITGGNGQLGTELSNLSWSKNYDVLTTTRKQLDICKPDVLKAFIDDYQPDYIVNAAAYTAVDKAEEEPQIARAVNEKAVEHLAAEASRIGAGLIHISTDYVFDGFNLDNPHVWYKETDETNPLNVYGLTKLAGEQAALSIDKAVVLRTSWVYSPHGSNFVHTMRRLANQGNEMKVVGDQYGCPTSAYDIAKVIVGILDQNMQHLGLFHCASPTDATWWDFATEIVSQAGHKIKIKNITTDQFPLPAKRPADTRISSDKLLKLYGLSCPPWVESLGNVSKRIDQLN